jgi:hypothetical protein
MVFWIAILVGALFVWLGVRMGFFETWGLLFNIVISIYVAIYLAPTVAAFAPTSGNLSPYCVGLSLTVLGGGCFALLYGLSYVFLTSQYCVPFPKLFDVLVAGGMGFLAGFLVLSFVALVITATPLAEYAVVETLGLSVEPEGANMACIAWCCDLVHSITGLDGAANNTQSAILQLMEKREDADGERVDPNEPAPPEAVMTGL